MIDSDGDAFEQAADDLVDDAGQRRQRTRRSTPITSARLRRVASGRSRRTRSRASPSGIRARTAL